VFKNIWENPSFKPLVRCYQVGHLHTRRHKKACEHKHTRHFARSQRELLLSDATWRCLCFRPSHSENGSRPTWRHNPQCSPLLLSTQRHEVCECSAVRLLLTFTTDTFHRFTPAKHISSVKSVCVCVCVWERERDRGGVEKWEIHALNLNVFYILISLDLWKIVQLIITV